MPATITPESDTEHRLAGQAVIMAITVMSFSRSQGTEVTTVTGDLPVDKIDSTASPKRPEGVIGVFKSTLRSESLRSAKVSHRYLCWNTMNPMVRPIAWASSSA